MAIKPAALEAAKLLLHEVEGLLDKVGYKMFLHVTCMYRYGHLSVHSFHEKIKYLFRNHPGLVSQFNPLLPDPDQFSHEELQEEPKEYKNLEMYKESIEFINTLRSRVGEPSYMKEVCDFVKLFNGKEIGATEFYGRVYERVCGDFVLMKQVSNVLEKSNCGPAYVECPGAVEASDEALNTTCKLSNSYSREAPCLMLNDDTPVSTIDVNYLYKVDLVMKRSEQAYRADARGVEESDWYEEKRYELDKVLKMLERADKSMSKVVKMVKEGRIDKWDEFDLRRFLVEKKVQVKLVERICGNIENLKLEGKCLEMGLEKLRKKRDKVLAAHNKLPYYTELT